MLAALNRGREVTKDVMCASVGLLTEDSLFSWFVVALRSEAYCCSCSAMVTVTQPQLFLALYLALYDQPTYGMHV